MKLKLLTLLTFISCFLFLSGPLKAQSCIPTNINGTTINLLCNQVCSTLVFQIPHIKGTGDYIVSSIPYNPYPYTVAFSNAMPETYVDDVYGYLQTMPFNFCFYDSIYNQFVAGSNGLLTFDIANKSIPPPPVVPPCGNSYNQNFPIPYISNNICSGSAAYYPKASIMGMFTDLYPVASACPPDRKIAWHIEGTAPCRKLVLNYYHVGMFGNGDWSINGTNCNSLNPTTFQIVLHESTGLIEVNIEKKGCNGTVGTGYNAILGVQDWTRTKAVAAPGKNATIWNETNTAYRFTPSGPGSRFVSSELYTLPGVFVMTADTLTTVAGLLDVRFNNACFPAGSNQFVVKSIFSACDNPINQLISYDTITVNRLNSLGATATTTNASCGPPNGTITVTIPFGIGNPPYTYVLDGGAPVVAPSPYTFTNVASGPHVITVTDASAGCNSTINVTVNLSGNIPATTTASATSCAGVNNGSITIISAGPGTGPYLLFLDGGPPVATASLPYTFSNLSAGNHTLLVTDQGLGCSTVLMNVNVPTGIGITGFVTTTATSCTGAANGTITATALSGVPPFTWQLDGGPVLPGTSPYTFTNVSAGAHIVRITDNLGCISGFNANVAAGPGINGSTTSTATTCPAASNGSITATALSGTAPFTWSLDGAPPVPGASPYTFTNVAAGLHTITIIDNLGCNVVMTETVAAGPGINGSTTSTATSCGAVSNGTITATALTGTAPFTWSLDGGAPVPGASPYTFTNVAAGLHTVTITDNVGCNVLLTETVAAGAGNTGSATSTATSCPAVSNGTITATALTGTAPFTWSLDGSPPVPGASPYTFTNVAAGPHTVTITDNVGCNVLLTETVAAGAGNTGSATSTATSCPAVSNGTITATALTGTAPFNWQLDGGAIVPGASPYTFTNVPAGPHTVTIIDNVGCDVVVNVVVNAGAGNTGSATSTATSCPAVSNGTITATALTGTAPFTWSLDGSPPVPGASPYTFINVAAGPHTVTINDNLGCSVAVNVTVIAGAGITANLTSSATACAGVPNGTITADATSGTAPFTYSLDGGAPQSGANPYTFINVASGLHTITVTDNVGCSYTNTVTVAVGPGVSGNGNSTPTSCPSAANGTITADATAGTAPFTWQLDAGGPVPGATPHTFINVSAGPHTVTITDNFGCNVTINVFVTPGPILAANVTAAATTCSGAADGTITVTPTNGIAPYAYSLDGAAPVNGPPPYTFTNVPAGPHFVVITDAANCVSSVYNVVVNAGPVLTTTVTVTDALCNGGATGTITVAQPVIGVPPYQYSLDGVTWQASNIFNGLVAGNYTVYYRESLGCQGSQPVTVNEPTGMTSSAATVAAICNGQSNGIITITASGGVSPYNYSINAGASWQASNVFNVAAGTYTIIIRDANNCTKNQVATVTEPAVLTAASVNTNASCDGGNDGVITVNATGGNTSYTYSIDGVNFQPSNVFNVAPGPYTVTVIDNLGCSTTFNTVVGLANNLTFTPQVDPAICEGTSTQLQLTSNATIYSWTPATGLSNANISNPVANPIVTTQYTVTATLGRCSANDIVIVNVNAAPIPDAGPPGVICYGQTYQLQGSGGVQYTWTPSTYLSSTTVSNPVSSPIKTITYTLSEVVDALGCKSLTTSQVTVDVTPPIKVKTYPFDTVAYAGDQFQLNATSIANIYTWTPATGLSDPDIANPVVTAGAIGSDVMYRVTASTAAGCKGEGYVKIKVYTGPDIYVPTGFTPNGDGKNDRLTPFPVGIASIKYFRVFNRWGQLLFSTNRLHDGWDGRFGGVEQPSGVYVWVVEGITKNNKVISKKGTVTLIR